MFLIPFLAVVADVSGKVLEKIALSRKRMAINTYLPLLFLLLFFVSSLLSPIFGAIDRSLVFQMKYLLLLVLMIVLAVVWNILSASSMQKEKLYEHEMILMLSPALTIILASIFNPADFDLKIFGAAMVAAIFLIVARLEKGYIKFNQYTYNMLVAIVLQSFEAIVINALLQKVYSPVSLYAFRTGFVFLFYLIYFRPHFNLISRDNFKLTLYSAFLGALCMILRFYGYKDLGIIQTTLILIVSPVFLYLISARYFHERIGLKAKISAGIILLCIAYATYIDALSH